MIAAKVIREIRRKNDRLGIQGKIHVQDYFDYYNIPMSDRYVVHFEKSIEFESLVNLKKYKGVKSYET